MSGSGAGIAVGDLVLLERLGERDREHAARRAGARARAAQERGASVGPPSSWIVCIGTTHSANRCAELELARVGDAPSRAARPSARRASSAEQLGVAVERGHAVAGARELERDAAGAGADVEDRVAVLAGQRAPQRQVLGVARRTRGRARSRSSRALASCSQNCATCPRAASSSRSSSSAV